MYDKKAIEEKTTSYSSIIPMSEVKNKFYFF